MMNNKIIAAAQIELTFEDIIFSIPMVFTLLQGVINTYYREDQYTDEIRILNKQLNELISHTQEVVDTLNVSKQDMGNLNVCVNRTWTINPQRLRDIINQFFDCIPADHHLLVLENILKFVPKSLLLTMHADLQKVSDRYYMMKIAKTAAQMYRDTESLLGEECSLNETRVKRKVEDLIAGTEFPQLEIRSEE